MTQHTDQDLALAQRLQAEWSIVHNNNRTTSLDLELVDPNPDVLALFVEYDKLYFNQSLGSVVVKWSNKMTLCAGLCEYRGGGCCTIKLSEKLLRFRSRKEVVETLLHEMIHAYLFVTQNRKDREAHGPEFISHMDRLNKEGGYHITVYHNFTSEVNYYRLHHWQCQGRCKKIIKRAMNRAPNVHDPWWSSHQKYCGGNFSKISEPPKKEKSTTRKRKSKNMEGENPSKKTKSTTIPTKVPIDT
eukprot:TRINITY_DN706_c0_g3_i1.p1 TRINITY_DN706_c0_g3~~TRINITY_DN706_c0_g3_i1.p1  ORF type:complete len:244 (+),score=33.09 TRINITY_DN706_c0_g3_i1:165-896(+)